ncbi:MAG: hypothetical protein ACT443_08445, partial [Gemmatimonadota bacterium]
PLTEAVERLRRWLPVVLAGPRPKQSFTSLNEMLLMRFGFNPRDYGVSFKELMLAAAERKLLEISTEGSMDFAVLPGRAPGAAEFEQESEPEEEPASEYQGDVRFEYLEPDDQRTLIRQLDHLEATSRFLTVKYLVERISHSSVLPTLSEGQLKGLLLKALQSGIFEVEEVEATSFQTNQPFIRRELYLNRDHPAVSAALGAGPRASQPYVR